MVLTTGSYGHVVVIHDSLTRSNSLYFTMAVVALVAVTQVQIVTDS